MVYPCVGKHGEKGYFSFDEMKYAYSFESLIFFSTDTIYLIPIDYILKR